MVPPFLNQKRAGARDKRKTFHSGYFTSSKLNLEPEKEGNQGM